MDKYSDWLKIDLHIHTDKSNVVKKHDYDGVFDLAMLKDKLIANEVKIFSLTDHNIINVDAYCQYYESFKDGDPILFVGCEFDINVKQDDDSVLTYHTLIIFNEKTEEKVREISGIIEKYFTDNDIIYESRCVTNNEIFDLFSPYHFFYIPHAGGHKNIIDAYKGADIEKAQEMVLLLECAHEKVKEVHRIKHNKGFDKLKHPEFRNKEDEAFINFSDNHCCDNYPTPKSGTSHEFYCIKGQPTFESIRFAFIDPKSRIKKVSEVEVLKRFDNYIHSIRLTDSPSFKDTTLFFSPNLNVIIGGRSSGKSLLFNILGNKIGNVKSNLSKYSIDVSNFKVKSFLDAAYKSSISYNLQDVIYINQGDIVNYFENNSLKDLLKESGKSDEYRAALDFIKEQKNDLIDLIDELVEVYSELFDSINSNFTLHNKDIEAIFDTSYFFRPIEQVEDKTISFQNAFLIVQNLSENIQKFIDNENWTLTPEELVVVNEFKKIVGSKESAFQHDKGLHISREAFIEAVNAILRSKNATLDLNGREKEASSLRLGTLKRQIFKLFRTSVTVEAHCLAIENYKYNCSREIEINKDVSVIVEIENKEDITSKIFEGLLNNVPKLNLYEALIKLAVNAIKIKNFPNNSVENFRKKIYTQLKPIFDYFDKPVEYLKYSTMGTSKNNSPGFNSEKYLETILIKGQSKVIFIDQPEDNLGNKFIAEKLIDLLRELKFKKQIFLVTHNPSIVVYGDAESVIMCTNEANVIQYEQFVLEDKFHQKEICNVLDGGQYIFEQRAKKYNIKKLINQNS